MEQKINDDKEKLLRIIMDFYKEAQSARSSDHSASALILSSGLNGFVVIILFLTLVSQTNIQNLMNKDILFSIFIYLVFFIIIGFLLLNIGYYLFLKKCSRSHNLTGILLEKLIYQIINNEIEDDDIIPKIKELLPQIRIQIKRGFINKKYAKNMINEQGANEFIEWIKDNYNIN